MTITELLTAIRQPYADLLAQRAYAQESYVEPAYRYSDGTLATDGTWNLPCRADVIPAAQASTDSVRVDSQTWLQFETVHFKLGESSVELQPFVWDWLSLEIKGLSDTQASTALIAWFLQWFDEEDENESDEAGLQQVVHFMSEPQTRDGGLKLSIDLGSAPAEALEDLLFALSDAGSTQLRLE